MPVSQGEVRPELNLIPAENSVLRILILNDVTFDILTFNTSLEVLKHYIKDKHSDKFTIEILYQLNAHTKKYKQTLGLELLKIESTSAKTIKNLIQDRNIDVIYGPNAQLSLELIKSYTPVETASTPSELKLEIESFLTGKNIAWSFDDPVWNTTWLAKYAMGDKLSIEFMNYLNQATNGLSYSSKQIGYVRALANKVGQVKHAQEQLISLLHGKNKSERNATIQDTWGYDTFYDYSFELSFHLGNYYFLISGCLDIVGRLCNDLYDLGLHWKQTSIENKDFQKAIKSKNKELFELVKDVELSNWCRWLKKRRNHIAHASTPNYSNILKPKRKKLTDKEVEDRIKEMPVIMGLLSAIPGNAGLAILNQAKFVVRMHEDNEIFTRDGLEIVAFNSKTQQDESVLFHPLIDIKLDYEKFSKLMSGVYSAVAKQ